jgi:transcriptional/translational regulatory protein YebC/TACO1
LYTAISKPENAIFNKLLRQLIVAKQLIARDMAKQHQLKNQLTKSHESSLPTIGRDNYINKM